MKKYIKYIYVTKYVRISWLSVKIYYVMYKANDLSHVLKINVVKVLL